MEACRDQTLDGALKGIMIVEKKRRGNSLMCHSRFPKRAPPPPSGGALLEPIRDVLGAARGFRPSRPDMAPPTSAC